MTQIPGYSYTVPVVGGFLDLDVPFFFDAELRIEALSPSGEFSYQQTGTDATGYGDLPMMDLFGAPVRVFIDDALFDDDDVYFARITTSSGYHDVIGMIGEFTSDLEVDYWIHVGGDPLPALATPTQVQSFIGSVQSVGPIPAGVPFGGASGSASLADIPGIVIEETMIDLGDDFPDIEGPTGDPLPHSTLPEFLDAEDLPSEEAAISEMLSRLFGPLGPGTAVDDISFTGDPRAVAWFDDLLIEGLAEGTGDFAFGAGILLSSGGMPKDRNTEPAFSVDYGMPGDPQLTATAQAAFPLAGGTEDAAVIEFTIELTDPAIAGLRLGLVFGSEEYPDFIDTSFVDIAAVYVNGVNVALFNNDPTTPLSVTQRNVDAGNFIDNYDVFRGAGGAGYEGDYAVEWNAFSRQLVVRAPLQQGSNAIKIGVADTGDQILDSVLFLNRLDFLTEAALGGGVLNFTDATGGGTVTLKNLPEEVEIGTAPVTLTGPITALAGNVFSGFKPTDAIDVKGAAFGTDKITVKAGSAIVSIDSDGDGTPDAVMTFTGDFGDRRFTAEAGDEGTMLTAALIDAFVDVTGTLTTAFGRAIDGVAISASMAGIVPRAAVSDGGAFSFALPELADVALQVEAVRDYAPGADPAIGTGSALEALRLSVGLDPAGRSARDADFIAADINGDGSVTTADALEILRLAVGLGSDHAPRWVFVDAGREFGLSRDNVTYEAGLVRDGTDAGLGDVALTGILVGNLLDTV